MGKGRDDEGGGYGIPRMFLAFAQRLADSRCRWHQRCLVGTFWQHANGHPPVPRSAFGRGVGGNRAVFGVANGNQPVRGDAVFDK